MGPYLRKGGTFLWGSFSSLVGLAVGGGGGVERAGRAVLINPWVLVPFRMVTLAVAVDRAPPGRNTGAVVALVVLLQLLVGQDAVLYH